MKPPASAIVIVSSVASPATVMLVPLTVTVAALAAAGKMARAAAAEAAANRCLVFMPTPDAPLRGLFLAPGARLP